MTRMHPYANSDSRVPKSVLRRREGDTVWDAQPPRAVPPNMDPENADDVGRTFACNDSEALQASIAAYHAREAECVEAAPSGRNIVLAEERGRFFELGAAPADLRGDSRSLSDVAEVKPPVDTWDSLAAEVLDYAIESASTPMWHLPDERLAVYADRYYRLVGGPISIGRMYGAASLWRQHAMRMDEYADRCFRLMGGPLSLDWVKAALHTSLTVQLDDLIVRTDSRLEHLKAVPLPQFNVRTKAKERETADPASWTPERNAQFCEDFHSRVPDALTQRFRLKRVAQNVVGFDATPRVLEALLCVRDEVLPLGMGV